MRKELEEAGVTIEEVTPHVTPSKVMEFAEGEPVMTHECMYIVSEGLNTEKRQYTSECGDVKEIHFLTGFADGQSFRVQCDTMVNVPLNVAKVIEEIILNKEKN